MTIVSAEIPRQHNSPQISPYPPKGRPAGRAFNLPQKQYGPPAPPPPSYGTPETTTTEESTEASSTEEIEQQVAVILCTCYNKLCILGRKYPTK